MLVLAVIWLSTAHASAASVFYQPQNRDSEITTEQWQQIFVDLRQAGHGELIVQWTAYDDEDFGGAEGWLARVVDTALSSEMRVWIGLYWDSDWFAALEHGGSNWGMHLNGLFWDNLGQAVRWQGFSGHQGFSGWYLPLELPDRGLTAAATQGVLEQQLARLREALDAPLALSSYFTGFQPPQTYADWLLGLKRVAGVDIWVQDGAGVGQLSKSQRNLYLKELDCSIGIVREAFEQTSAPDEPFTAIARPPDVPPDPGCHKSIIFSLRYLPEGLPIGQAPQ